MKKLIGKKIYDTSNCEILASKSHYNNITYAGATELLLAPDGALLVARFSNGQDPYLNEFLIPFEDFEEDISYFDEIDDKRAKRLAELGLREMRRNIKNMDENALVGLELIRDYTEGIREFTGEKLMEIKHFWRMIPSELFEQAKKWGIDVKTLIHEVAEAWLQMQSRPYSPILVVKRGWVGLTLTVQREKEEEVRVPLSLLYSIGCSFLQALEIIADDMKNKIQFLREEGFVKKIISKLLCSSGHHSWEYDKDTVVKCNRMCTRCGKWEHSIYDMSYGDTN